jgi:nicotinate phosphoribosyltransferase
MVFAACCLHTNMTNLNPLLTDLYQLTMAASYWKSGRAEQEAVFHLFFRKLPFGGGYVVAAGLADAITFLRNFTFENDDLSYLSTLTGNDGSPLFEPAFLDYLAALHLTCDVDAIPEGTVVFPHEPLLRVRGPILQAQLLETALLNIINFQTLIATKAARVCYAARGEPVIEFGLRRAQGPDGALMASRAAFIGGCESTSNVLAGRRLGIPVRGTHAHSWVMSFDTELESFLAYAAAMPHNSTFLVDTYDTLDGVRHAIEAGRLLRGRGHSLGGIRLDSGDLAWLSIEARRMLDEAGFEKAVIVASNDLDEQLIESLKAQGAAIGVWGVGTKLVTGGDQPALGGVYKLSAIRDDAGRWQPKVKLSEQAVKVSNPGIQQVRRFSLNGEFLGDAIFDELLGCAPPVEIQHPVDPARGKVMPENATHEDLLVPILRTGRLVYEMPSLGSSRARTASQLEMLHPTVKRFLNPHAYPAGIERGLAAEKSRLIAEARAKNQIRP